jgi:hypothetical protein
VNKASQSFFSFVVGRYSLNFAPALEGKSLAARGLARGSGAK